MEERIRWIPVREMTFVEWLREEGLNQLPAPWRQEIERRMLQKFPPESVMEF